jgi:hypothetical protein
MQDIALFLEKRQLLYRFSITLKHVITHYYISKKSKKNLLVQDIEDYDSITLLFILL